MISLPSAWRTWPLAAALAAGLSVSGCVIPDTPEKVAQLEETNDPLEPLNRYFFDVNTFLDEFAFKPLAWWYKIGLPDPAQDGIRNALANLRQPWTAVNDVFQGSLDRAYTASARFVINSTVGIVGLFDVATGWGFPQHEEDFGQTLATTLGLPEMMYLVLPVFGPSNPRDAVGMLVDNLLDPVNIIARGGEIGGSDDAGFATARGFVAGIDTRSRNLDTLEELRKNSVDFYATIRSVYRQRRENEIRNGAPGANYPGPNLSDYGFTPATQAPATAEQPAVK
jgi:phospholipid-binding lipoprotein MlaA